MDDLLAIPAFLQRDRASDKKTRKNVKSREKTWDPGVPVKRPTKAQIAILTKRDWAALQVIKLSRAEAAAIIKLGVGPEARFTKDKKHQFPDKKDDE